MAVDRLLNTTDDQMSSDVTEVTGATTKVADWYGVTQEQCQEIDSLHPVAQASSANSMVRASYLSSDRERRRRHRVALLAQHRSLMLPRAGPMPALKRP
jgi:hypothetical protein